MTRATWLRAVACRLPFLRVSDRAYSALIAADGTIAQVLPVGPGILTRAIEVPVTPHRCAGSLLMELW